LESRQHSGRSRRDAPSGKPSSRGNPAPLAAVDRPPDIESFAEWKLAPEVLAALDRSGISRPTPIQRLAIGPALDGYDVIAKAETGTGKTIAFGAPLMTRLDSQRKSILGLVLCPTRELAQQVAGVLQDLGRDKGIKVALVVGGEEMEPQILALRDGAQVVVGTPGRVLDLHTRKLMNFPWTEFAVLDEADEMLEIGFLPDVEKILSRLPEERQTLLFSATFPPALLRLAREHTRDAVEVATAAGVKSADTVTQSFMRVGEEDRPLALLRIIERSAPDDVFLVFCHRRTDVDILFRRMGRAPFPIKALHGGYDQPARFRVMEAFRERQVKALIATDVAARGLDVAHVTHVINYAVPKDVSAYTHRIGRTGRAGRDGEAITFVVPTENHRWKRVLAGATWPIPEAEPPGRASYGDRPARHDRGDDRAERAPRDERRAPDDRRAQDDRPQRDERAPRRDERVRDERPARDAHDERPRDDRRQRDDRPARSDGPMRDDRPARSDGPSRTDGPSRNDRPARDERAAPERRERPAPPRDETPREPVRETPPPAAPRKPAPKSDAALPAQPAPGRRGRRTRSRPFRTRRLRR
jgi:superfamily II DNA/RNA helicase